MMISLLVIFGALLLVIAWQTASSVVRPRRVPVRATPAALSLPFEDVTFQAQDGIALKGWWLPAASGGKTIILCHGISANREQTLAFAPFLHAHGYQVFLFDFRAHGESEGGFCTVGAREQEDLLAAIEVVRERGGGPIGVLGLSMGGATAILTAARSSDIQAVVADSAFSSISRLVEDSFSQRFLLPRWPMGPLSFAIAYWRTAEDLRDVAPRSVIGQISPRPVLLIHGDADRIIPVDHSRYLYIAAKKPKDILVLPGVGHISGHDMARPQYEEKVLAFFDKWLH